MKRRPTRPDLAPPLRALSEVLAALDDAEQIAAFLRDLCTPAEIEALTDRWRVVPLLLQGMPYREIHDLTGVSVTTVGRVARCLSEGDGYRAAAQSVGLDVDRHPQH